MKKQNNIEDIFQDAFKEFEVDPGANSWANIQTKIGAESAAASSSGAATAASSTAASSSLATTIAAIAIGAIAIGGYFYFDDKAEKLKAKEEKTRVEEQKNLPEENKSFNETQEVSPVVENKPTSKSDPAPESDTFDKNKARSTKQDKEPSANAEQQNKTKSQVVQEDVIASETKNSIKEESKAKNIRQTTNSTPANIAKVASENNQNNQGGGNAPSANSNLNEKNDEVLKREESTNNSTKLPANSAAESSKSDEVIKPTFTIPNAFSPNQDGVNDEFEIEVDQFDRIEVKIFSKSNRLIFQTNDPTDFWNGNMLDGSIAPVGFYYFQITVIKEGQTFNEVGGFSLKR